MTQNSSSKFSKKNILFILFLISISFFAGIHLEFKAKITEEVWLYSDFYATKTELKNAKHFVNRAKQAISKWKEYHVNTNKLEAKTKAREVSDEYIEFFTSVNLEPLPVIWNMYARYFNAYLLLICKDIKGTDSCLERLGSELNLIEELLQEKISIEETKWLEAQNFKSNVRLLKAQYNALMYKKNPNSELKLQIAIESLRQYGSQKFLLDKDFPNDRLLGELYYLTYPSKIHKDLQVP